MKNHRRLISNVLFAICAVLIAVSMSCFWNANQTKQRQLQKSGDDPFTIVFSDKIQSEHTGTGSDEMTRLNNQRLMSENRGWISIISGVGLLVIASALKAWRRKPVTLRLEEKT